MYAVVGLLLVIASIALFAWSVVVFRNPSGPAWRDAYLLLEAIVLAIVGLFLVGMGLQIEAALQYPGSLGLGLALGVLAVAAVAYFAIWRLSGVAAKVARFEAADEPAALKAKRA